MSNRDKLLNITSNGTVTESKHEQRIQTDTIRRARMVVLKLRADKDARLSKRGGRHPKQPREENGVSPRSRGLLGPSLHHPSSPRSATDGNGTAASKRQRLLRMTTVSLGRALGVAVVERELAHHLTEVCDGGSLASYRYRTAYEYLEQASAEIILGLNWLHEHGIVHHWHDLKPHNTALVNGSSHCVIADYGGARFLNGERKLTGTRGNDTSRAMTTAFVAPETRNLAPSMSCVAAAEPRNPHAPALSTS